MVISLISLSISIQHRHAVVPEVKLYLLVKNLESTPRARTPAILMRKWLVVQRTDRTVTGKILQVGDRWRHSQKKLAETKA